MNMQIGPNFVHAADSSIGSHQAVPVTAMKHVAFTGARSLTGMNPTRLVLAGRLFDLVFADGPVTLHHGDCLGADAWAHRQMARAPAGSRIEIHPPDKSGSRAWCTGADIVHGVRPFLVRNREIVLASSILIALPSKPTEILRSGSWSTVRYARSRSVEVLLA